MLGNGFKSVTTIQDSKKITDTLLHVNSIAGLIQAIGYIKWKVAEKSKCGVAFRGQCEYYDTMNPSLYRALTKTSSKPNADKKYNDLVKCLTIPHNKKIGEYLSVKSDYLAPLLQHYGVKTDWLDIVDNIWIALWFACYRYVGKSKPLVSFKCRPYGKKDMNNSETFSDERYCYITLIRIPLSGDSPCTGHYIGDKIEVVDARYCLPSIYIRPHMQHGLLMRTKTKTGKTSLDFSNAIEGVIRIDLDNALKWIELNPLLTTGTLFPPPDIDTGLSLLLKISELRPHLDIPLA
mgnify:CR=1 FL=1